MELSVTKYPKLMLAMRIIAALSTLGFLTGSFIVSGAIQFIYFTVWGASITILVFIAITVCVLKKSYHRIIGICLIVVWLSNVVITIIFWILLVLILGLNITHPEYSIFLHSGPLIFSSLELFLNKVEIKQIDIVWSVVFYGIYIVTVNVPYSILVEPVYEGNSYDG